MAAPGYLVGNPNINRHDCPKGTLRHCDEIKMAFMTQPLPQRKERFGGNDLCSGR